MYAGNVLVIYNGQRECCKRFAALMYKSDISIMAKSPGSQPCEDFKIQAAVASAMLQCLNDFFSYSRALHTTNNDKNCFPIELA